MKNIKKILLSIIVAFAAIWGSFYTENLTERQKREQMSKYNPEQLVEAIMKDSIGTLQEEAISIKELAEGIASGHESFASRHGRTLGIGSPIFYVIKGECENVRLVDGEEIQGVTEGITFTIPLKYIFGNIARDASGWFNIDNFQNTMDFNAVSAAMNAYIGKEVKEFRLIPEQPIRFVCATAVPADAQEISSITLIPYLLK